MVGETWMIEPSMTFIQQLDRLDHVTDTGEEVFSKYASKIVHTMTSEREREKGAMQAVSSAYSRGYITQFLSYQIEFNLHSTTS